MKVPKFDTSVTITSVFGSLLVTAGLQTPKLYQTL